ncbi:MAG TPA: nucleotide sugar dehydrogenase, partial [Myxococcales bacterium]|nr:nucleotide sugar dehydrogenase [Myxococcales bacterium]
HLADVAAREIFGYPGLDFELSQRATAINQAMPIASLDQIEQLLGGSLENKSLLLLGVSYRQDVGDTRYGPSETFVREAEKRNAKVECHDPLVTHWQELNRDLPTAIPSPEGFDAVVFAVSHSEYQEMDLGKWLSGWKPLFFDANAVLSLAQRRQLRDFGCQVAGIGRGKNCE